MSEMHATVLEVKKIESSRNGNPRYSFKTGKGWFRTKPDLGQAFALPNDFPVGESLELDAKLTLNGRGHVIDWEV